MEAAKKPRCPNWREKDRVLFISEMQPHETVLFRKYKGPLRKAQVKADAWKEIVSKFNAQADIPRSLDQLKKQFDNVKTRAKQKYDHNKKPKTGGGPRPASPSASQRLSLEQMSGRPNLCGLPMAYDTEDPSFRICVSSRHGWD
ncbi:uncharacterized protein LOC110466737 [Mizuhopecten yessoensis]|uniref:uncharacterized protein LOC110466737 n=1 Tax=Mizuhopecten yessoensis TaxID=6573 RepID=UPI000B4599DC|nr:uncharacterized protein LOC110466737 [Mizuhopecten yessoensis]